MRKTKQNFSRKGEGEIVTFGVLIVIGLIVWIIASFFGFNYGNTSKGTVKYDDCREVIQIQPDSWHTYFGTFVCNYSKTQSGAIIGGECVRIVNDRSLFSTSNACAKAYVYEATSSSVCAGSTKDGVSYPYLGYDDMCHTTPQSGYVVTAPDGTKVQITN
jgi:hypothetical protein